MIHNQRSLTPKGAYSGDETQIINNFQTLVRNLAWHLAGSSGPMLDVDDLMQVGLIALTDCARRHDREKDDGLAAYAKLRVRGAMIDAIRKAQLQSRSARAEWQKVERARQSLLAKQAHEPSDAELADELGMSASAVTSMRSRSMPVTQIEIEDGYEAQGSAFASDSPDSEEWLIEVESREQLAEAIASLPERHRMVIQLYFMEELNLTEIAAVLDVSVPRVHQLKGAALQTLRKLLAD